ncbi:MAG TPA: L-seryl-tRNA(Sec) selenium transferase [Gemmatimonadaceae bacterium]|nr:L-seryl-tRNA(Sec) selenium transferase [Gemmatimonadaceae bacterium]
MTNGAGERRDLPGVGTLLESPELAHMLAAAPRQAVTNAVRAAIARVRTGSEPQPVGAAGWSDLVISELGSITRPSLRPVINATGVVLHTNLGRAPLAAAAIRAVQETAAGFCNLEYDLETGERGSRYAHCVSLLRELTGCEDALIVNNCAAALILAVDTFARDRGVVISRGELVEIGGSFRIPDILRRGGARLVEVGTTNRTHLADYESAITTETGAILKVHRSNFSISGFTAEVSSDQLAALGKERGIPVVHDLGSGLLIALDDIGLRGEPTAAEALRSGSDIVVFSGDKMLGGPQAGIVLGKAGAINAMRSNPLARALRVDKLTISALGATLSLYRDPNEARREIPVLAMLSAPAESLRDRAAKVAAALEARGVACEVVASESPVGGGAFPSAVLQSSAVALRENAEIADERLRGSAPAVVGRAKDGRLLLDLRSVLPHEDELLVLTVGAALA